MFQRVQKKRRSYFSWCKPGRPLLIMQIGSRQPQARLKERVTLFLFCTVALNCFRARSTSSIEKEPETVVPCTCTFLVCANCKKNQTDAVLGNDKIMGFMTNIACS